MRYLITLLIAAALPASGDAIYNYTLLPANLDGLPGATIGWGFTVANNSTAGEELFIDSTPSPDHIPVLAESGTFTLFTDWQTVDLLPGQSLTDNFDSSAPAGLGELTIDPNATPGAVESGTFNIVFDFLDQIGNETQQTGVFGYQITVDSPAFTAAPEPGASLFALCGTLALGLIAWRKARLVRG
jgi:hypothetical protein